jgi:hypothetical protein
LVACDKFALDRRYVRPSSVIGGDQRFHLLAVLSGLVQLDGDPSRRSLEFA